MSVLMDSIKSARENTDTMRRHKAMSSSGGSQATGDQLFAGPAYAQYYAYSGDSIAADQYKRFEGWSYVCISAIAKRAAKQKPKMAVKTKSFTNRSMDRFTKSFNGTRYGTTRRYARDITDAELRLWSTNKNTPSHVKSAISANTSVVEQHEFLDALNNPNDLLTKWSLFYITIASIEITGRCYWWVYENVEEGKIEIWPIPVSWVKPNNYPEVNASFRVMPPLLPAKAIVIPGEQMAVFTLPDPSNPIVSLSPLQTQIKAVHVDETIQTAQAKAMDNGIFPGVMLVAGRLPDSPGGVPGERPVLTAEQRSDLIAAIKGVYQGVNRYDEPFIVDGLIEDVKPFTNKPAEMAFLESGTVVKARIFGAFGVNPIIIGEIAGANRAQAAVAEDNFVSNVVNPLLELIGEVITQWIGQSKHLSSFGSAQNVVMWIEPAESHDADLELARWQFAELAAAVTKNEIRVNILKLPPMTGGDDLPVAPTPPEDRPENQVSGKKKRPPALPSAIPPGLGKPAKPKGLDTKSSDTTIIYPSNPVSFITSDSMVKSFHRSLVNAEDLTADLIHQALSKEAVNIAKRFLMHAKTWEPSPTDHAGAAEAMAMAIIKNSDLILAIKDATRPCLYEFSAKAAISQASVIQSNKNSHDLYTKAKNIRRQTVVFSDEMSESMVKSITDSIKVTMEQDYWKRMPNAIRKLVAADIQSGLTNGDNAHAIATNILSSLKGDGGMNRAKTIAATECASAMNCGNYEAIKTMYEDSLLDGASYIGGIRWRTMLDFKVRCSHSPMEGKVIKVGTLFAIPPCGKSKPVSSGKKAPKTHTISGGTEYAPYPAYYGLSAGNRIHCRCNITAELDF